MTNPGNVIQGDPGDFGAIAQGLGTVLTQMRQQKENQSRLQQLENHRRYYEALAQAQQQELNMRAGEQVILRAGKRQAEQRAAISGGGQPGVFQAPGQVSAQPSAQAPGLASAWRTT